VGEEPHAIGAVFAAAAGRPHSASQRTRQIQPVCHLPLIVAPNCAFCAGNGIRVPVEGKAWVFDNTMEHEAWNRSDQARMILLFETWRPELTEEGRGLVTAMFIAIGAYSGEKPGWEI
jgi:aspartate beta-hydroxylase